MYVTTFAFGLVTSATFAAFVPAEISSGGWANNPLLTALSPLASQFVQPDLLSALFNTLFLLIAGRFVERALGPWGLIAIFTLGAYGGALARLVLTWASSVPGIGSAPAVFAIIGAYLALYGVPRSLPIAHDQPRMVQISILAAIWFAIQVAFVLIAGDFEFSQSIVAPLGGFATGALLAQPLLRWRYRRA